MRALRRTTAVVQHYSTRAPESSTMRSMNSISSQLLHAYRVRSGSFRPYSSVVDPNEPRFRVLQDPIIAEVDDYLDATFVHRNANNGDKLETVWTQNLLATLKSARAAGLPEYDVSPTQGKLLMMLGRLIGAKRILEVGTLGGYSTLWLGRSVISDDLLRSRLAHASDSGGPAPGGREVISLELDPAFASVAEANWERAGLGDICKVRVGPATESLRAMAGGMQPGRNGDSPGDGPQNDARFDARFDMAFLDANKSQYVEYFDLILPMMRDGGLIVADNVVRGGAVLRPPVGDENAKGAAAFNEYVSGHPGVESVGIQLVGKKGHDGIAILQVLPER